MQFENRVRYAEGIAECEPGVVSTLGEPRNSD